MLDSLLELAANSIESGEKNVLLFHRYMAPIFEMYLLLFQVPVYYLKKCIYVEDFSSRNHAYRVIFSSIECNLDFFSRKKLAKFHIDRDKAFSVYNSST